MADGLSILMENWLFIALLAFTFFFGDLIYLWIKSISKQFTEDLIGNFLVLLIIIVIFSPIPLIVAQIMTEFFPLGLNIFILACLLGASFWKYYSED